jgi:AraC family transcriptional regulator
MEDDVVVNLMDVNQVIVFLKAHYNHTTVKEAAAHFGYSESHFCREFKKRTGISPQDYLVATKVQNSVEDLLISKKSILNTQLKAGYLSDGSFTNRIKKSMTLSPKQLSLRSDEIFSHYKTYENDELDEEETPKPDVTLNLVCDEFFEGIVFVGLFKKPIPNQPPVIGKAILKFDSRKPVYFHNVPQGRYYCLACVIHKTYNPLKLFVHKDNLRGILETVIDIPGKYEETLLLRPPIPTDPPITLNLPLMFINALKAHTTEYRADLDKK